MAVGGNNVYPSIQTVLDLVRSLVLDDMAGITDAPGEGQIYVDDMAVSVTMSNFFNSAVRELCRKLRTSTGPMLIRDNYLLEGLTPVNSSQGLAAPNPAAQVYVDHAGYFDGTSMNGNLVLPADYLLPIACWERENGSNARFHEMHQAVGALSSVWQGSRFGEWEWRQERLNFRGALTTRDLRLRYYGRLVNLYEKGVDLETAFIPIADCEEALADLMVVRIARRISPERLADAQGASKDSMFQFLNEQTKTKQGIEYTPPAFGSEAGPQLGI